jgi:MarR family transcriptional regulator, organic hydroperoxide resistance regulator
MAGSPYMKKQAVVRSSREALNVAVLRGFRTIYGSVRYYFREVQRSCGISGSQLWILHQLANSRGIGVSDLAAKLAIHQSTCSQLVEKLVKAGYVTKTRRSKDQRRVELAVSARGQRALGRAPGPAEGILPEAISELSAKDLRSLHRGLLLLIDALDIKDERAAEIHLSEL